MKAAICTGYGSPDVLQIADVPQPKINHNDVLIRIHTTMVTASDCIVRGFTVSKHLWIPMGIALGFRKPRRPILGMICSGVIEAVGASVTAFNVGDAVIAVDMDRFKFGMYAEYIAFPADKMILHKPEGLSFDSATALPYGGLLALYFLRKGHIEARENVLIYGASGAIGTIAVQIAKYYGATVTGVCSTRNLELVKSIGVDTVIDYTQEDFTQNSKRYDLILNAVGKHKAKLTVSDNLTNDGVHVTVDDGRPQITLDNLKFVTELADTGHIRPVIDRTFSLDDIVEAHRYVDTGRKRGNVIITVDSQEKVRS